MANDFDDAKEEGADKLGEAGKDVWEAAKRKAKGITDDNNKERDGADTDEEGNDSDDDLGDYQGEDEEE